MQWKYLSMFIFNYNWYNILCTENISGTLLPTTSAIYIRSCLLIINQTYFNLIRNVSLRRRIPYVLECLHTI